MLQFNPYFRPTAEEALKSSMFKHMRIEALEAATPYFTLDIDVDRNEYEQDYEFKYPKSK